MSISRSLAAFIGTLLLLSFSSAHSSFYVVAGGGKKIGTEIKVLPYNITEPGFYFITKNLDCSAGIPGIAVKSSNVTLDLMGFTISGPTFILIGTAWASGIEISADSQNTTIRNGTITGFYGHGITSVSNTTHYFHKGCQFLNLTVSHNYFDGINLNNSGHLIKNCRCFSNGEDGISVMYSVTLVDNICCDNRIGISTLNGCVLRGNTCNLNSMDGILAGNGNSIHGNTCTYNDRIGLYAGRGSTLTSNACFINFDNGIEAKGATVIGNSSYQNGNHGIYLRGDSYVAQNTCYNNATNINNCTTCTFGDNHAP